ncbi:ABC-2 family transporter protein [Phycisphaerae bacterium RAS1]|nr:ABC-2 family transporter protein [Phycisphaerae bacterium RAS1]
MFNKLAAIISTTFHETIRQPIFGVLTWVAVGLLILNPSISAFSLESGKDSKIMQDVGLATLLLYGLLTSAFTACSVISREIESRTVLTVISKPVSRPLFLLGKFLGVCSGVLLGYFFLTLVFLLTVRHGVMEAVSDPYDQPVLVFSAIVLLVSLAAAIWGNYVYGWHFSTTLTTWVVPLTACALLAVLFIGPQWQVQSAAKDFGNMQIIYAVSMVFCAVLILSALAVSLSTRFGQALTLVFCAALFVLGLVSDHYFGRFQHDALAYDVAYRLLPNFQFFWVGDALTQELTIEFAQVARVAAYSGCYSLAVIGLGVALFQTREVG